MRRCSRCGLTKPASEFHRNTRRRDGLQAYCKACRKVLDRERYLRTRARVAERRRSFQHRRAEWLRELKTDRPCADCGRVYPPEVMHWDHLPGTEKLGDLSAFKPRSKKAIAEELAKCELVCANCHAIRTVERAGWDQSWKEEGESRDSPSPSTSAANADQTAVIQPSLPSAMSSFTGRRCAMCALIKPKAEFHNSRTGQFSYCRDCRRAYDRRYYHTRGRVARLARRHARNMKARAWMADLKRARPCSDCGGIFPAFAMHWDHLPEYEKMGQISDFVLARRRTLLLQELEKCELVCANCHALRTSARAGRSSVGRAQLLGS